MSHRFAQLIVVAGIALGLGTQFPVESTIGQEKAATKSTEKAASAKVARKPRGRLPAYYAQVGLSTEQRHAIYSVQIAYGKQIADLQKQIDALEMKQDAEVVGVLNPEQKKKLDELLATAKKRAEERRNKSRKSS
jgi:hypothetical protein